MRSKASKLTLEIAGHDKLLVTSQPSQALDWFGNWSQGTAAALHKLHCKPWTQLPLVPTQSNCAACSVTSKALQHAVWQALITLQAPTLGPDLANGYREKGMLAEAVLQALHGSKANAAACWVEYGQSCAACSLKANRFDFSAAVHLAGIGYY